MRYDGMMGYIVNIIIKQKKNYDWWISFFVFLDYKCWIIQNFNVGNSNYLRIKKVVLWCVHFACNSYMGIDIEDYDDKQT